LSFLPAVLQGGDRLNLEWERGRVFDQDVGQVFAAAVKGAGSLRVTSITTKEDRKPRPPGLNTVELLKVASSALNIGPAQAMAVRVESCVFGCVESCERQSG
jgi:DNA topoisomerase-3